MNLNFVSLAIAWLATSVSFFIVSKLPIGVEIDSFGKAMISAVVLGFLNVLLQLIIVSFVPLVMLIIVDVFLIVINTAILGLAAWLVQGFRLRWGIWSALLGAVTLNFVNSLLSNLLEPINSFR